jgi:outer membrane lipopolysaccharide assembly protein LptE/RlpB
MKLQKKGIQINIVYLLVLVCFSTACGSTLQQTSQLKEPVGLILTWQQDPKTTMTIDWQTKSDDEALPVLYYQKPDSEVWIEVRADQREFLYSDRTIHRVEQDG